MKYNQGATIDCSAETQRDQAMPEHAHVEVYRGYRIVIDYDSDPMNPRKEDDNVGTMICFHRKYNLGDEHNYSNPQDVVLALTGKDEDELGRNPNDDLGDGSKYRLIWEPLYLYDHSGITMSTSPFSCPWDSGQVGIIYATYDRIQLHHRTLFEENWTPPPDVLKTYEEILKAEVETYDQYLRGEIYGYRVYAPDLDRDGDTDEEEDEYWNENEEDSCWGFYGSDAAIEAAKEFIDGTIEQG
jgi:hypothetical protein